MRLFDPARPRLPNGRPMYPWDRPLAAVPDLVIEFEPEGHTRHLVVMLTVAPNTFRWFCAPYSEETIEFWQGDLEGCMRYDFQWPGISAPIVKMRASIDDLEIEI